MIAQFYILYVIFCIFMENFNGDKKSICAGVDPMTIFFMP